MKKRKRKGTIYHLFALFCTVSAKVPDANLFAIIFFNEIKDLELILKKLKSENRSKLRT